LLLGKLASQIGNLLPVISSLRSRPRQISPVWKRDTGTSTSDSIVCILEGTAEPGETAQPLGWRRAETGRRGCSYPGQMCPSLHISPFAIRQFPAAAFLVANWCWISCCTTFKYSPWDNVVFDS